MIRWGGKIPVSIHPLFWVMAFLIGFLNGSSSVESGIWVLVVLISVLVHEYGHALSSVYFGQKASIELIVMGGLTQRKGPHLSLLQNFVVVLSGPLAGFLLCGISYAVLPSVPETNTFLLYGLSASIYVNLFWTVLNLLPVQPLDGGKLLAIIFEGLFGFRGVRVALFLSLAVAVGMGSLCFAYNIFLPGMIFIMLAFENLRAWRGSMIMSSKDRDTELQALLQSAEKNLAMGNVQEAKSQLIQVRSQVNRGLLFIAATELLGQLEAEEGDSGRAYSLLSIIQKQLSPPGLALLHQLAYETGHLQHAVSIGGRNFRHNPGPDTAVLNALSHAVLGEVQPAIGWLRCALQEGLNDVQAVLEKVEFDHIRQDPDFHRFVESLNLR